MADLGSADTMVSSELLSPGLAEPGVVAPWELPAVLGRYELIKLLGAGGIGAVYLARDNELEELVALKMLRDDLAASLPALDLLRQEVRLARRVTHPNVARIFEFGEHEGRHFLTMEYIEGDSLASLVRREGRLPLARTVQIITTVCQGLQAAHEANVVHRDVKPDNVLVGVRGRVVISDFGIARIAREGQQGRDVGRAAGTPGYMAPEQLAGAEVSTESDVYALGVMTFEMLTGGLPWKHLDPGQSRGTAPPVDPRLARPDVPEAIARVVMDAMAPEPEKRPRSPVEFAEKLTSALTVTPLGARSPVASYDLTLTPVPQPGAGKQAVAVLPFENRGRSDDDYLAEGFTEDLIDCLSAIGAVRVLSRGATARFAGDPREAHEIGRQLDVSLVIEGSLQRAGDALQIKVRAIGTEDGMMLWARRYQVAPEDLLTTSDAVARELVGTLPSLGVKREPVPVERQSAMPSAAAMEAYLRAKEAYRNFINMREAISLFEEALRLAGDNPLINAGYAMTLLRAWMLVEDGPQKLAERARTAAETAMAAAPHLGEPHMALALLHLHTGDPVTAVAEFRTAISLAPSMAGAHAFLGELLAEIGRIPEALMRLDTASRIDPIMLHPNAPRRRMAALLKDWDRAYELTRRMPVPSTPMGSLLTLRIAAYRGDKDLLGQVAELLEAMDDDPHGVRTWVLSQAKVYLGRKPAAEVYPVLSPVFVAGRMSYRRLTNQLQTYAEVAGFAGDLDVALHAVEQAVSTGMIDLLWLDHCPFLDGLRGDRQFLAVRERLVERAHLAYDAFWAES